MGIDIIGKIKKYINVYILSFYSVLWKCIFLSLYRQKDVTINILIKFNIQASVGCPNCCNKGV